MISCNRQYLLIDISSSTGRAVLPTVLEGESTTVTSAHDLSSAVKYLDANSYSCLIVNPPDNQQTGKRLFDQLSTRTDDVPLVLLVEKDRIPPIDWPTHLNIAHTLRFDPMNPTEVVDPIRNIVTDAALDERVAQHRQLRETINETILALDRRSSPKTVYEMVCTQLVESGLYHAAWWSEYNKDSQTLIPTVAEGISSQFLAEKNVDDREYTKTQLEDGDCDYSTLTLPIHGKASLEGVFTLATERPIDDAEKKTLTNLQTTVASRITRSDLPSDGPADDLSALEFFTGTFSHELRNYLQKAKSTVDPEQSGDDRLEEVEKCLDRIQELDHVMGLLTKNSLDPRSISALQLSEIAETVRDRFPETADEITVLDSTAIRGNRPLVELLVENLVRNAFEHGGAETHVRIGSFNNGFFVEDTGCGIPPEHRDAVFEWGYTRNGGSGKGLAIVERIATLHGWSITVTEGETDGARFEIETTDTKQEVLANDSWNQDQ